MICWIKTQFAGFTYDIKPNPKKSQNSLVCMILADVCVTVNDHIDLRCLVFVVIKQSLSQLPHDLIWFYPCSFTTNVKQAIIVSKGITLSVKEAQTVHELWDKWVLLEKIISIILKVLLKSSHF